MKGKGVFIWQLKNCGGGTPQGLAQAVRALGITWAAIKIADGVVKYNQRLTVTGYKDDLIAPAVYALREAGVSVWGWQYVYLANPAAEGRLAAERSLQFGLDGFLIDGEAECKTRYTQALTYMAELRARWNKPVGLCSFRFPTLHRDFPWKQFLSGSDFHCPQVYWVQATNPAAQLVRSIDELRALKDLPVIPVGAAYSEAGWRPTVGQIREFYSAVQAKGLPGYSYWVLDASCGIERYPEYLSEIASQDAPIPDPLPPLTLEERVARLEDAVRKLGGVL